MEFTVDYLLENFEAIPKIFIVYSRLRENLSELRIGKTIRVVARSKA